MNALLRRVFVASLLRQPLALALSLLAIALGVALGLAVQLIHAAALDEFGRGMRVLSGSADLQVVGAREGFDEALYPLLAQRPEIHAASPVLQVESRLPGRDDTLTIIGVDLFQLARVQPALLPRASADGEAENLRLAALRPRALFLSASARDALSMPVRTSSGDEAPAALASDSRQLRVQSGLHSVELELAGSLPDVGARIGAMDIAGVQQVFDRFGVLTRIDLRVAPGVGVEAARQALTPLLPPGVSLRTPESAATELGTLSRAYRVNLTMLAAIALVVGGFLVFSTQLLAVARRRREFALLRALGMERGALLRNLLYEGGAVGAVGGVAGVAFGYLLAALALRFVGGDLGAGYFRGVEPKLQLDPGLVAGYLLLGIGAGMLGTWLPARSAARVAPAQALRAGESERAGLLPQARPRVGLVLALGALAAASCLLPPVAGIALGGYVAVGLILAAAVLAVPVVARATLPLLRMAGAERKLLWRLAHARLAATPGQAVVAGAGVVASVALAVSMAIMVSSFRVSVDDWLAQVLPADLYLRASSSAASGYLDAEALDGIEAFPGVAGVDTTRLVNLRLSAAEPVFSLLARPVRGNWGLPLVAGSLDAPANAATPPAWISEAAADRLALRVGSRFELPLGGRMQAFTVAGIWRDYARQHGAALIDRADYVALTGDVRINDAAIRAQPGADVAALADALRAHFGAEHVTIALPGEIRAQTLRIFDRTFLITYLMEAVTVLIGLFGIATTFAALASTRRGEFGMLRHLGFTRARIGRLITLEGGLTAALGVLTGLLAGGAMSWVLIAIVNRQSFHWSMDLAVPWLALAVFALALVSLAALVARLAARQAMQGSAVRAVKADY